MRQVEALRETNHMLDNNLGIKEAVMRATICVLICIGGRGVY
jgi:hypothetical protein